MQVLKAWQQLLRQLIKKIDKGEINKCIYSFGDYTVIDSNNLVFGGLREHMQFSDLKGFLTKDLYNTLENYLKLIFSGNFDVKYKFEVLNSLKNTKHFLEREMFEISSGHKSFGKFMSNKKEQLRVK